MTESVAASHRRYGPDWVGLDVPAMLARREDQRAKEIEALQREAFRRAQEQEQEQELLQQLLQDEASPSEQEPDGQSSDEGHPTMERPTPLLERIHLENLRIFEGPYDIALAPLTLIYGPNSGGKSTVIKGLKVLMDVIDAGRSDGLRAWDNALAGTAPRNLITYQAPEPEDPFRRDWIGELVLGATFRTRGGSPAQVAVSCEPNLLGGHDFHESALGLYADGDPYRKEFVPEEEGLPDEPWSAETYGEKGLPHYNVTETGPEGQSTKQGIVIDPLLFAHPDPGIQEDIFALAYLMRYLGPHRGEPGSSYAPQQGPFNNGWLNYHDWGIGKLSGYEVLNQMMRQLEIPYEFEPHVPMAKREYEQFRASYGSPKQSWILRDRRSGAPVQLDQVGYGISQLLPVIDVCVHARKQVICVEEPELHLHPRLQSSLGNLFATSVLKRRNQVIVETHSENLLLRVRRLIRQGRLLPHEVAVLYVDNDAERGASVRRLRIGVQGELLDPWPTGFFDDSLDDVLGGWQ